MRGRNKRVRKYTQMFRQDVINFYSPTYVCDSIEITVICTYFGESESFTPMYTMIPKSNITEF